MLIDKTESTGLKYLNNSKAINQIYLYIKDPYEAKYLLLIDKTESTGLKYLNTQMIWIIFIKILKNIIQIKKIKSYFL